MDLAVTCYSGHTNNFDDDDNDDDDDDDRMVSLLMTLSDP